jgi:aromatic-L-amino-acid decarboxylase
METMNKVNLHSVLGDMPPDEFRRFGHQLIDWIADHFKNINSVSVLPDLKPGQIRKTIPPSPPKIGESMEKILDDIDTVIMPGMTHWNHPNFFAYFSITGSGPGILGELLSAALNVNAMLWKTCPAATELEQVTLDWLRVLGNHLRYRLGQHASCHRCSTGTGSGLEYPGEGTVWKKKTLAAETLCIGSGAFLCR